MSTGPTRDQIESYIAAWNRHDVNAILEYFADDCYYEDTAFALVNRGKEEVRAFCEHSFATMPDMHFDIKDAFIEGDGLGWEWTVSGSIKDGHAIGVAVKDAFVSADGASITRFRDGLIIKNVDYYDSRSFLKQLGVQSDL